MGTELSPLNATKRDQYDPINPDQQSANSNLKHDTTFVFSVDYENKLEHLECLYPSDNNGIFITE